MKSLLLCLCLGLMISGCATQSIPKESESCRQWRMQAQTRKEEDARCAERVSVLKKELLRLDPSSASKVDSWRYGSAAQQEELLNNFIEDAKQEITRKAVVQKIYDATTPAQLASCSKEIDQMEVDLARWKKRHASYPGGAELNNLCAKCQEDAIQELRASCSPDYEKNRKRIEVMRMPIPALYSKEELDAKFRPALEDHLRRIQEEGREYQNSLNLENAVFQAKQEQKVEDERTMDDDGPPLPGTYPR